MPIETPGSDQCLIQMTSIIGGADHNDATVGGETVHLCEQLVQRLSIGGASHGSRISFAANCINFIDEDDARCILGCFREKITNAL